MTFHGTLNKVAILVFIFAISCWVVGASLRDGKNIGFIMAAILLFCFLSCMFLVIVTVFVKRWSPITAPVYAIMQGALIGVVSFGMSRRYPGIVAQAIGLTIVICISFLCAYRFGVVHIDDSFNKKLSMATVGVLLYYVGCTVFAFTRGGTHNMNFSGGIYSVIFSIIIVIIAGLNLISSYDFIEQSSIEVAPKYMEWYAAFGLVVSLIWLYVEILELFSKVRKTDGG
jgi:uncharacterized YccA/Bax inhibitor family protein